jgi:ribokinase
MAEARQAGLFERVDLLALNLEEALAAAAALAGGEADSVAEARANPHVAAERAVSGIARARPSLMLSITAGKSGSWSWDGARIVYDPVISVSAEGTAGAGDAHLAGILAGLAAGLTLAEAQQLGTIVAAASVTSPHTIHPGIDGRMLRSLAGSRGYLAPRVRALLDNRNERS